MKQDQLHKKMLYFTIVSFSLYVVLIGQPQNAAKNFVRPSPSKVLSKPGSSNKLGINDFT